MPTPLCLLATKYGSDKYSTKHSYTAWYYEQFKDRRDSVRKVVEIGVGEGASLRMWREFFPNAMIYGMDNDPARCFTDERIDVTSGDQSDPNDLVFLIDDFARGDIDLFIDDGSHKPDDQEFTCEYSMGLMGRGVTYVIEDVADANIGIALARDFRVYMPELEHRRRYDNCLMVVEYA